jgi:hypothetical protein
MGVDKKFIMVFDKGLADKLLSFGYKLVSKNNNHYVFLNQNCSHFLFNQVDNTKFVYTNRITF